MGLEKPAILLILSAFWPYVGVVAEVAEGLEIGGNITEQKAHAMDLFRFNFHHTGTPLTIAVTVVAIAVIRTIIIKIKYIPPSILLLCLGYGISWLLWLMPEPPSIFQFKPETFFVFFLPCIIADAGWFLPTKEFFHNIGQISLYAVVGTILNAALTYYFLSWSSPLFWFPDKPPLSLMIFSVIISAVDPVAVISVFEETHVNSRLNILVFGESLLNDGVVIVLYSSLQNMLIAGESALNTESYLMVVVSFCVVVGFGFIFGAVLGLIGVVFQRLFVKNQALMPTLSLIVPYISYLLADTFGFSGLVALITCCIVMKHYHNGNVCLEMQYTTEFIYKNMGSYSEAFIFILLGFSTGQFWSAFNDIPFSMLTLFGIFFIRFIVIFFLTSITNYFVSFSDDRIAFREQFTMSYGGIRGAVCYGLIASVDSNLLKEKELYISTTILVIVFTTILQGGTISSFVKCMKVEKKDEKERKEGSMAQAVIMSNKHLCHFLEDLTLNHEENSIFRRFRKVDETIKSYLCFYMKPKNIALLEEQVAEETFYRKGTSFAGLPTDHSLASMHLPLSKSELFHQGYNEDALMPPCLPTATRPSVPRPSLPPTASPIPRNESISEILPNINSMMDRESSRQKRKSIYSRHNLDYVAPMDPNLSTDRPSEDEAENDCQMTFPYAKSMNQKLLAQQARSISQSVKDKHRLNRFISPHRALTMKLDSGHESPYKTFHASTSHGTKHFVPPRFTLTDEEPSPSPPTTNKPGRVRTERKVTTGTKTFVVGGEEIDLLPIHEDDDSEHTQGDNSTQF